MRARSRLPLLPALLLVSGFWSCGDSSDGPPALLLRLVDLAGQAEFSSFVDLSQEPLGASIPSELLFREAFDGAAFERFVVLSGEAIEAVRAGRPAGDALPVEPRLEGEGARRHLVLTEEQVFLCSAPVEGDQTVEVRIALAGANLDDVVVLALELEQPLSRSELQRPEIVTEAFAGSGGRRHLLKPLPEEAGGRRLYSASFTTYEGGTAGLLFLVVPAQSPLSIDALELTRPSPFLEQLLLRSAEFDHPYVRRVAVGRDYREALVLVSPGEARFRLRLPAGRARFSMSAGAPDHGGIAGSRIEVVARAGERELRSQIDLTADPDPGWRPLELDLSALAGREIELSLAARPLDPGQPGDGLAFGRPVIELDGAAAARDERAPDVILISLDTMRADRMSLYGAARPTTPFLEEFSARALVFEAAIAPAAYTLPSHASMLTGQLPDRIASGGPIKGVHPRAAPLLARDFRAAGYRTVAFTGGGYVNPAFGFDGGFERFATIDLGMVLRLGERADAQSKQALEDLAGLLGAGGAGGADGADGADEFGPRFLFLHTFAAHQYRSPAEDLAAVGVPEDQIPLLARMHEQQRPVMELLAEMGGAGPDNRERLELLYDGAQRVADAFVRHVVDRLREAGRLERTLIFIVSDHGEELYEHGGFGHAHQIYEELIHVPFIASGPGIRAGRNRDVVSLVDLAPTLRELCGLPEPGPGMDGRSLVPLLSGGSLPAQAAIARVAQAGSPMTRAYRGRRHKLLQIGTEQSELFDLEFDPGEHQGLPGGEDELSRRLRALLEARVQAISSEGAGFDPSLPAGVLEELEQLGYVGKQPGALRDKN